MLTRLSFFEDIVAPSVRPHISRRISATERSAYPPSRCLMNQAFSSARVASSMTRMPFDRQSSDTARRFAIDIGWPPAMFTLASTEMYGILSAPYSSIAVWSFSRSTFPLNG